MYAGGHPVLDKMTDEEFAKEKAKNIPEQGDRVKVKIAEGNEYEDITWGKVYEVVDEYSSHYVVRDDQFDRNAILKEHCEIAMGEVMFKKGDRVQIVVNSYDKISLLEEWSLQKTEWMCGTIIDLPESDSQEYYVQLDNGGGWYVPEELLQKLDNPFDVVDDLEKPDITPTLTKIIRFTQNNKGFSVLFEDGNITLSDWSNDPNAAFYRPKTIEELLELMKLFEKINEYKYDGEN